MQRGLTTRDVAARSQLVATERDNDDFSISHARLVQIENEESVPSIHKLFALSIVYGVSMGELMRMFIDMDSAHRLHSSMQLPWTHTLSIQDTTGPDAPVTLAINSGSAMNKNERLTSVTRVWDGVPGPLLEHLDAKGKFRYGVIGLSDYTMFPLIRPGSVVQIDQTEKVAKPGRYTSEYDRPIYFIELRDGFICSWCELEGSRLIATPHPLSPCRVRIFTHPTEAEIVGRVTGVALRLMPPDARANLTLSPALPGSVNAQIHKVVAMASS
jgi:transcriptional regulator with XRE-family HTH domain